MGNILLQQLNYSFIMGELGGGDFGVGDLVLIGIGFLEEVHSALKPKPTF